LAVKKKSRTVLKRMRSSARKAQYRGEVRSSTRTQVKKARTLVDTGKLELAPAAVQEAISALDKAAQKGVIHKNNAARKKSRLMAALHKAQQPSA
jgi:small subunit ribosomal protein S20